MILNPACVIGKIPVWGCTSGAETKVQPWQRAQDPALTTPAEMLRVSYLLQLATVTS